MVTCKICGLNVYDNSSLNRHMRRIHKIEPHFKCEENKTLYTVRNNIILIFIGIYWKFGFISSRR